MALMPRASDLVSKLKHSPLVMPAPDHAIWPQVFAVRIVIKEITFRLMYSAMSLLQTWPMDSLSPSTFTPRSFLRISPFSSRSISACSLRFFPRFPNSLAGLQFRGPLVFSAELPCGRICGVDGRRKRVLMRLSSAWDEKPYEVLPSGKKAYLDELDVVTFIAPPKELIPLDQSSFNHAAYLWKKIEDIPPERRHRLLYLLPPILISRAWQIAGTRYEDPKLVKKIASISLLSASGSAVDYYYCRTSDGPFHIAWSNRFKKALFQCKDGKVYGRIIGGSFLAGIRNSLCPLYFVVREVNEVMSTEQPCDLAYDLGDGLLGLEEYPQGFPRPAKHLYPFNDQVVVYIRYIGPGVFVGQAWQEGKALEQVPRKLCGEILIVKAENTLQEN